MGLHRLARRRRFYFGLPKGQVWEKVSVCLPQDGNGTGRSEAIWLTGWDGSTRFLNGTGREGIGQRVENRSGYWSGTSSGNRSGKQPGTRSGIQPGTRSRT